MMRYRPVVFHVAVAVAPVAVAGVAPCSDQLTLAPSVAVAVKV